MNLEIPNYKYINYNQTIEFDDRSICTLIGENGSGKSTILEAIFQKYIEEENKNIICFTSGQNELFSTIFNTHKKQSNRFTLDEHNIIKSFYFDKNWASILIFFATSLKSNGKVRTFLKDKEIIEVIDNKDISSKLSFKFRVRQPYIDLIKNELLKEEQGLFVEHSRRRTVHYNLLEKFINNKIDSDYDFDEINYRIVKQNKYLKADEVNDIFDTSINHIFTFLSHTTRGWLSNIDMNSIELQFKDNIKFNQLSDGEYQLLAIYAIIDLFDSEDTIFLLDEVDSHLHYSNINKLWTQLKSIQGKVVTTTHSSESILNNDFDSLHYIECGRIERELTAEKVFKKLAQVTGASDYEYKIASKIKFIALLDDEVDWIIFKKLAIKKLNQENVEDILNQVIPYKRSSSFNTTGEIFGKSKLIYVENFKDKQTPDSITTAIFLICDRDKLPVTEINDIDLKVNIDNSFRSLKKFNNNKTKTYLHSWKMLEIENYLLSKTMLESYSKLDDMKAELTQVNFNGLTSLDESEDVRIYDAKNILHPLYKANGFDELKLDEIIDRIPPEEISEDIVKMYEFIKSKVEN